MSWRLICDKRLRYQEVKKYFEEMNKDDGKRTQGTVTVGLKVRRVQNNYEGEEYITKKVRKKSNATKTMVKLGVYKQ